MLDTPRPAILPALDRFAAALRAIRAVESGIPASQIATLLEVARKPGLCVSEYARRLGEPQPVTSRNLRNLGEQARNGGPGFRLVRSGTVNRDKRWVHYWLTEKGQSLIWTIDAILDGALK